MKINVKNFEKNEEAEELEMTFNLNEAIDVFLHMLEVLKQGRVIDRVCLQDSKSPISMSLYELDKEEQDIIRILWENRSAVYDEEEIHKLTKESKTVDVRDADTVLTSLCQKHYLIKSRYRDKSMPFIKFLTGKVIYSVVVPEEMYRERMADRINLITGKTDILYIGINKTLISEKQVRYMSEICE